MKMYDDVLGEKPMEIAGWKDAGKFKCRCGNELELKVVHVRCKKCWALYFNKEYKA
jgi:hypothetical protein